MKTKLEKKFDEERGKLIKAGFSDVPGTLRYVERRGVSDMERGKGNRDLQNQTGENGQEE